MAKHTISSLRSGQHLGTYEGETGLHAYAAMLRDAGYSAEVVDGAVVTDAPDGDQSADMQIEEDLHLDTCTDSECDDSCPVEQERQREYIAGHEWHGGKVRALMYNAAEGSDMQMVAICQVALGEEIDCDITDEERAQVARHLVSQEAAMRECTRVIVESAAEAKADAAAKAWAQA